MPLTFTNTMSQYLAPLHEAEEWGQEQMRKLEEEEGFEEVVPGVWEKGDTQVAL